MTSTPEDVVNEVAKDAARFLQQYAKGYGAGAFATPTAKELATKPGMIVGWDGNGGERTLAVVKQLSRDSARKDFTGRPFLLPKGATVVTHIARTPGARIPDFSQFDYVMGYVEDSELVTGLTEQGRPVKTWRITAASEVIGVWARPGEVDRLEAADAQTITHLPWLTVPAETRQAITREVSAVSQWHDDFPYYSDGSWSAVSLRGFKRDDPRWGIKPTEMPKQWQTEHREALAYQCDWTVLADRTPAIRSFVESVPGWGGLERVRLLRMEGRGGKGGKLGRHTDIGDKAAGTRDGQIVRFHMPVVTDPAIKMHAWDLWGIHRAVHLEPWNLYYLDARKPHAVVNPTGVDRVHLVIDVVVDEIVRGQIAGSTACFA